MPRNQLLELKAKFYRPASKAAAHICTAFEEFVETPDCIAGDTGVSPAAASPQVQFFFYAALPDTHDETHGIGEQNTKANRSFALQLWRHASQSARGKVADDNRAGASAAPTTTASDQQQKNIIYLSKPIPMTATLLNQTVVLRYLYQQLIERQRQHSGATTSSGDSAIPHHPLLLASTVDETGAVRRIDLYRESPGRFVALVALGGQHGAPNRRVVQLVTGVLKVFSQTQLHRGCEPTELCGWPQAPADLTVYDLCKAIKMVRQFGLLSAVFPLELLLVRALTALFGESTDDYYRRRRGGAVDCQVHRLRTSSLVFLASTAVLESLPYLWRFTEAHDAVQRMAHQEEKLMESEQKAVGADDQAMLRTLQCTRTLLERYGLPTRKTNLSALIDRSQYFWPTSDSALDRSKRCETSAETECNGRTGSEAVDTHKEEKRSDAAHEHNNLARLKGDRVDSQVQTFNGPDPYRWTVPPCILSGGSVTCALCRSTFARVILAALVESSAGIIRSSAGAIGSVANSSQQRAIDLYVFDAAGASKPDTDYEALLPNSTMHVRITLPHGSLNLLQLEDTNDQDDDDDDTEARARATQDHLPWNKSRSRPPPPKITIERLNSIEGLSANSKVEFPLTSLYEWLQIVLWSHDHVCFDIVQVADSAAEFYMTNSSQHPYVLVDSNEQRLRSAVSEQQLPVTGNRHSSTMESTFESAPRYSMVPFDNAEFVNDAVFAKARSLVWYAQFAHVMRQYALRIVQNVNIPDSCNF